MRTRDKDESDYIHEMVCQLFCEGKHPAEIASWVKQHYGLDIGQKDPYRILHAEHSNFRFLSPRHNALTEAVQKEFSSPAHKLGVTVTLTDLHEDLVRRSARAVWDIIQRRVTDPESFQRIFSIGCSGGHTMKDFARGLRDVLREPWDPKFAPEKLTFKALVSGIDTEAAGTDPTSFFTYLSLGSEDGFSLCCNTEFELFNASPIVRPASYKRLRTTAESDRPIISAAFKRSHHCDVIVTSASEFQDEHSQLRRCYERYSPETLERLQGENCIGDILWQPVSAHGPMDTADHPFRTLTLIELSDLPNLIKNGTRVVLVLGPCAGGCNLLRTRVLYVALAHHLVTDVILSRRTANELLKFARRIRELRAEIAQNKPNDIEQYLQGKGLTDKAEQLFVLD